MQDSFVSTASDIQPKLAERIVEARQMAVLSQAELAERLAVSPRTVQNWEAGMTPRPKHRRVLLAFLAETEERAA